MQEAVHRKRWLSLAIALAMCGAVCAFMSCVGTVGYVLSFFMSDAGHGQWLFALLAYPAYVFRKWSRAAWQEGAGTRQDWAIALAAVTALIALLAELFEHTFGRDVAGILSFALLVSYILVSWTLLGKNKIRPRS